MAESDPVLVSDAQETEVAAVVAVAGADAAPAVTIAVPTTTEVTGSRTGLPGVERRRPVLNVDLPGPLGATPGLGRGDPAPHAGPRAGLSHRARRTRPAQLEPLEPPLHDILAELDALLATR